MQPPRLAPDRSWQVVILRPSQFSPRTNQPIRPPSPIAHPQSYPCRLGLPPLLFPDELAPISLPYRNRDRRSRSQKSRHNPTVTHIAMSFGPTIAWKASPTRTPPPICTSAPFLKPRWSQDRGAASRFKKSRCAISRNPFDDGSATTPGHCCSAAIARLESKFLIHREESRVSQISSHSQKIFIKNLTSLRRDPLFEVLGGAMWISNY
jgi:hypothetical protein